MKTILIAVLILFAHPLLAQNQFKIDSLNANLQKATVDSTKVNILSELGYIYRNINADSGLSYCQSAIEIAKKIKWEPGIAKATMNAGMNYIRLSNYTKSLECFEKSLAIHKKLNNEKGVSQAMANLGNAYKMINNYPMSLEYYMKALKVYEDLGDTSKQGIILGNIGLDYSDMENYPKAMSYLNRALAIHEQIGDKNDIGRVLNAIAGVYGYLKQPDKALETYKKALNAWEESGNKYGYASVIGNLGVISNDLGNYSEGIVYNRKAIELNRTLSNDYSVAHNLMSLGVAYSKAENAVLLKHNVNPTEKYTLAAKLITEAKAISKSIEAMNLEDECFLALASIYEKQNKYKEAYEAQKQYSILHDSIINDDKKEEIARLELQYEFDKKQDAVKSEQEKKDAMSAVELQRQKDLKFNFAAIGGVITFMSLLSLFFYKRRRDARFNLMAAEQKEKETASTLRIKETELKALRLQMNPHFIDNALQSIQYFLTEHKAEEAEEYLIKFSNLMRAVLMNSERDEIPLSKELEVLEWYMQLENLRMNHPFSYEFSIDKHIEPDNTFLPPNILQPFVENSIKHGLLPKAVSGKISIYINKKEDDLHVIVEDNGIGRSAKTLADHNVLLKRESLGIKITQERLNILNRTKNSNAVFNIVDLINNNSASGTRVELFLPLQS